MNAKLIIFIVIFSLTVLGVALAIVILKSDRFKRFWRTRGRGKVQDAPASTDEIEIVSDKEFETNEAFYPTSDQLKAEGRGVSRY
jgi:hypothetical protein